MSIEIRGLAPLLSVFDMPRALAFYRDGLGAAVVMTSPPRAPDDVDWALLRLGDAEFMLNTAHEHDRRPPAPDPARVAAHRDAALFFGCPDVDGAYAELVARGLAPEAPFTQSYGMRQMYLTDPDGYALCFQWEARPERA